MPIQLCVRTEPVQIWYRTSTTCPKLAAYLYCAGTEVTRPCVFHSLRQVTRYRNDFCDVRCSPDGPRIDDTQYCPRLESSQPEELRDVHVRSGARISCSAGRGAQVRNEMRTILLIILVILVLGALPTWPYSAGWGYYPSGGLGLLLLILLVLAVLGKL
jgi:hypothetical protein